MQCSNSPSCSTEIGGVQVEVGVEQNVTSGSDVSLSGAHTNDIKLIVSCISEYKITGGHQPFFMTDLQISVLTTVY